MKVYANELRKWFVWFVSNIFNVKNTQCLTYSIIVFDLFNNKNTYLVSVLHDLNFNASFSISLSPVAFFSCDCFSFTSYAHNVMITTQLIRLCHWQTSWVIVTHNAESFNNLQRLWLHIYSEWLSITIYIWEVQTPLLRYYSIQHYNEAIFRNEFYMNAYQVNDMMEGHRVNNTRCTMVLI